MESDSNIIELLQNGITAAKAGQRDQARALLMQVVEQDEENVLGWMWLCGLVDDPAERQVCLENVLALEPDNQTARKGLALLQQQQSPASPPPLPAASPGVSKAPADSSGTSASARPKPAGPRPHYKRLKPRPLVEETPAVVVAEPALPADPLQNEYACPYCLAPTGPNDSYCRNCRKDLWLRVPRREKPSTLFKVLFWLQVLNTAQYLLAVILLIVATTGLMMTAGEIGQMEGMAGMDVTAMAALPLTLFITIPVGLYNIAMVVGLYKRWRPIFYLYLINSVLALGAAAAVLFLMGWSAIICGGPLALFGIVQFFLVLNLGEDFTFDKYRLLLRADRDLKNGQAFFDRAHRYADRKMWGMAALHFRRACYQLNNNIDCHLALTVAYINSKQYGLATKSLAEAKRIDAGNAKIGQLEALLAKQP